jgi:hypothetical protein
MNAGYSSGWCEESFDVPLVSAEIMCRAKGDEHCRFIMAHPAHIEGFIQAYFQAQPGHAARHPRLRDPRLLLAQEARGRAAQPRGAVPRHLRVRHQRAADP